MKTELNNWAKTKLKESTSFKATDFLIDLKNQLESGTFDLNDRNGEELNVNQIKAFVQQILESNLSVPYDQCLVYCCISLLKDIENMKHNVVYGSCDTCGCADRDISVYAVDSVLMFECFYGCDDPRSIPDYQKPADHIFA